MKSANRMGGNEEVEQFFTEIGLELGSSEKEARRARNSPAHGGAIRSDEDMLKWTRYQAACKVLFQRTLLQLLGYQGNYVDKTTSGLPLRPISEPAGGK